MGARSLLFHVGRWGGGHLLRTLKENLPFAWTLPSFLKFLGASSGAPLYCSLGFCFVGPCPGSASAFEFSVPSQSTQLSYKEGTERQWQAVQQAHSVKY